MDPDQQSAVYLHQVNIIDTFGQAFGTSLSTMVNWNHQSPAVA